MASDINRGVLRLATPPGAGGPKRATRASGARPLITAPADYYNRIENYAQKIRETQDVGDIIGILDEALNETRALHTANEVAIVRQQVVHAEQRIEQLKSELELVNKLVREDQLTGALNRRGLDGALEREAARAERNGTPLCIALIDIDDFKKVNDTHGHQVGDIVLVHLVAIIKETIRTNDLIGRYGGEEFMVLLPDARLDTAAAVMGRLQRELASKQITWAKQRLRVTFSAGIAAHVSGEGIEALIKRADQALYEAKHVG
ncbi:MAG: GGDEF domain-containing protein, partial [Burkholderiales bacterium]